MDTTLDLAIVRNRLLASKYDLRDQQLLEEIRNLARSTGDGDLYARILVEAISNAMTDARTGAYGMAARELDLAHNIKLSDGGWSPGDEAYFIKGVVATYMENASIDRIKALFALFSTRR